MGLRNIDDEGGGAVDVDALNAAIASAQATADSALQVASITAGDLGDVSNTADAALSNAQAASNLAGLAATQVDFNALAADLGDTTKPRVHRWVSDPITKADFTLPGGDCEVVLAGAVSLPGEYLTVNAYFILDSPPTSADPATTSLSISIGTKINFRATLGVDLMTENGRSSGGAYFAMGALIKTSMFAYLDTIGGDLEHIQDLAVRVVIDYTLPGEPS